MIFKTYFLFQIYLSSLKQSIDTDLWMKPESKACQNLPVDDLDNMDLETSFKIFEEVQTKLVSSLNISGSKCSDPVLNEVNGDLNNFDQNEEISRKKSFEPNCDDKIPNTKFDKSFVDQNVSKAEPNENDSYLNFKKDEKLNESEIKCEALSQLEKEIRFLKSKLYRLSKEIFEIESNPKKLHDDMIRLDEMNNQMQYNESQLLNIISTDEFLEFKNKIDFRNKLNLSNFQNEMFVKGLLASQVSDFNMCNFPQEISNNKVDTSKNHAQTTSCEININDNESRASDLIDFGQNNIKSSPSTNINNQTQSTKVPMNSNFTTPNYSYYPNRNYTRNGANYNFESYNHVNCQYIHSYDPNSSYVGHELFPHVQLQYAPQVNHYQDNYFNPHFFNRSNQKFPIYYYNHPNFYSQCQTFPSQNFSRYKSN